MSRRSPDYWLFYAVIALVTIGVVTVYSASYPRAAARSAEQLRLDRVDTVQPSTLQLLADETAKKQMSFMVKHMVFAGAGCLALLFCLLLPTDVLRAGPPLRAALIVTLVLLALTYTPLGVSNETIARRWVNLFGITLQPSEFAKLVLAWYLAWVVERSYRQRRDPSGQRRPRLETCLNDWSWLWRPAAVTVALIGLVLCQPHLGGALMLVTIAAGILLVAGLSRQNWLILGLLGALAVTASVIARPYQMARLTSFLHPMQDATGDGMHIIRCGTALARGGFYGRGMGRSIEKFDWLPECHSDSIFAVLGEEYGLIGTATVLALFTLIGLRGLHIAAHRVDVFGRLLAVGLTASLFGQGMLNIGVTSGLLPQTGVGLPFITYGGTSMVVSLATVGLLLNLSRESGAEHEGPKLVPDQGVPNSKVG